MPLYSYLQDQVGFCMVVLAIHDTQRPNFQHFCSGERIDYIHILGLYKRCKKSKSTRCVYSVAICTVVTPGQHKPDKRTAWKGFTFAVYGELFTSSGRTELQTV